ncbi:MAG: YopX family protein [Firmicutes bacterium]|nr:YopX family protein [Bacillota bacterium]
MSTIINEESHLYRAKTIETPQKWVVGNLITPSNGGMFGIVYPSNTGEFQLTFNEETNKWETIKYIVIEIDPTTCGRCTGLKDCKGNLIYEDDIIIFIDGDYKHYDPFIIEYDEFCLWWGDRYPLFDILEDNLEYAKVISNTHNVQCKENLQRL